MNMKAGRIWVLTGERGAGKTSFCYALAAYARGQGWDVAGLLSPGVFYGGVKTGIRVASARSGDERLLASTCQRPPFMMVFGAWYFDRAAIQWGNDVLLASTPCDLLIVDEIGPLELFVRTGWQAALDVLHGNHYRMALVVIRPSLLDVAKQLFDFPETIAVDPTRTADQWMRWYWPKFSNPGSLP